MIELLTTLPNWVYDWTGGIIFMISLWYFYFKLPKAWHWSNATLLPYFLLFIVTEMWMLAGLQIIYLMFGLHGWFLWKLQEWDSRWAKAWEHLAVPFGFVIFLYTVYITQFTDVWAWMQFAIVSIAIVGSVLLVLKNSLAWPIYIVSNVIGLVYYPHAGLWALTIVQIGAIVMSVIGYRMWREDERKLAVVTEGRVL